MNSLAKLRIFNRFFITLIVHAKINSLEQSEGTELTLVNEYLQCRYRVFSNA